MLSRSMSQLRRSALPPMPTPDVLGRNGANVVVRKFEFVQSEWLNSGIFIGAASERDPIAGSNDGTGEFIIPARPVRQRLQGLPGFVVTRGGEYFFLPGARALRWLADPNT
jgi:hypothetical protein